MRKITFLSFVLLLGLLSCTKENEGVPDGYSYAAHVLPEGEYVPDNSFKIVAYYSEARVPDSIELVKFKMITHLHYAFAYPNTDGTLKAIAQPARFETMIQRAKENGVKTAISLSGGEAVYSALAADPLLRTKLIKNIKDFVLKYQLDGVDIDWEYPRLNKANDITYEAFVVELSDTLHRWHKYLSAAVTPALYQGSVKEGITPAAVAAMDFVNIMAYDGIGWDNQNPNHHSTYRMAETALNVWLTEKGLPKEKAVLGFPAYGKTTANVALAYRDLLFQGKANPLENSVTIQNATYYYNSLDVVKQKAVLAKQNANGLMVWEFYQDANGPQSMIKAANDAIGRTY
ncbi:glycosyl hydrolase family 18 protein [Pedobacter sp. SYSU D00535]|uniref:glycosyl hydrolase family 18 protein n=1 Tax=Pedobacter sp. SYSU D00535 TaxID=2810308 RepID=UPI001A96589B|nr:glycosyl hydrolase family 18 protein [Pedobacter sp. SYSU D00535]